MDHLLPLKKVKHAQMMLGRRARRRGGAVRDRYWAERAKRETYSFDLSRHIAWFGEGSLAIPGSSTFPVNHLMFASALPVDDPPAPAPMRLFALWTGGNELSPNRRESLRHLCAANANLETVLVTPATLAKWVADGHPLHPAYEHLSLVHRSDYLRAYLMYHYGGAYADIKPIRGRLSSLISTVNASQNAWGGGPMELGAHNVGFAYGGSLGAELKRNFARIPWASCFTFKPRNRLVAEWLSEIHRRLDYFHGLLELHPAQDANGTNPSYPVSWFALHAAIFGPLCLRYAERVVIDRGLTWNPVDQSEYR